MPLTNRSDRWGAVSIGLHWLVFLLVLTTACIGLTMGELDRGMFKLQVYAFHKSLGLTVLGLTAVRLAWRLLAGTPSPEAGLPRWQRLLAGAVHAALYVLLFLVPFSGWWYNSASGFPLKWFGLFALPSLGAYDPAIKHDAKDIHETLFYVLACLVFVHAAAALAHHYLFRDGVLARMLPWVSERGRSNTP